MSAPLLLSLYRAASSALAPLSGAWIQARARKGKEAPERVAERFGRYRQTRPQGALIWLHAASVGESGVALTLLSALRAARPEAHFLITTGTRTSAALVARRAPDCLHAFAPLDAPAYVRRFLDHWRPDLGVFIESELWPNLMLEAKSRSVRLALVNARLSPSSLARWMKWRASGQTLFSAFDAVSAADARTAQALSHLRGASVNARGNLKLAARANPIDADALAKLREDIGARPVWAAISTHAGEDEIVLAAHKRLMADQPEALLILIPRHPERGEAIAALADAAPRRALGQAPGAGPVYIADTMGELDLFLSLAPVCFIAGSLLPHLKGHSPVEPAQCGSAIITGPFTESFEDLYADLSSRGAMRLAADAAEIAFAVSTLQRDQTQRARQCEAARAAISGGAEALAETLALLEPLLPRRESPAHATA